MSHNQAVRIPQHEVSTPFATEPQTTKNKRTSLKLEKRWDLKHDKTEDHEIEKPEKNKNLKNQAK